MDRPCYIVINMWSVYHIECMFSCHRNVDYVLDFASTDTKHDFVENNSHKEKPTTCAKNILLYSGHMFTIRGYTNKEKNKTKQTGNMDTVTARRDVTL